MITANRPPSRAAKSTPCGRNNVGVAPEQSMPEDVCYSLMQSLYTCTAVYIGRLLIIALYTTSDHGVWVIHLSTVAKLMNSKVSCGVRNVSPFQVMFARPPSQVLPPGMAQLSQDMRKALRTVDELEDAVRLLPEGQHLLERLWARPILGATNSLLCSAYTDQQDHLLTYQKLVRASNLGERLEEADVKTIVCDSAQGSSIVGSIVEPNEHVHAMVHTMVEAVATVRAPWRAMTDGVSLLTTLGLKIVHGLADGNCFGDAFLKTAHSGLAVACVCVSCPSSILEFR